MAEVTSVSAGPPWGGLYLNPPSSGGLCDGVTTMPSARPLCRPRLWVRMACEMAGVGVRALPLLASTETPFATRTSMAVRVAGADKAWLSSPMKSCLLYTSDAADEEDSVDLGG